MNSTTRITERGREVLRHLAAGRPADTGLSGRSQYGGLEKTLLALRRAGLVTVDERITEAGRAVVEATDR